MGRSGEEGGEAYRLRIGGSGVGTEGKERWDERDKPTEAEEVKRFTTVT